MGSPCLATGGASMGDIYGLLKLPYALTAWVAAAFCAPAVGPLLSGFSVVVEGWRWALWEVLWGSAPIFILMFMSMPETSANNILLRRARRLRKLTGNPNLKSQGEIDQGQMSFSKVAIDQMWKPIEIFLKDPAVFFTNVYTSLIYGELSRALSQREEFSPLTENSRYLLLLLRSLPARLRRNLPLQHRRIGRRLRVHRRGLRDRHHHLRQLRLLLPRARHQEERSTSPRTPSGAGALRNDAPPRRHVLVRLDQ